MTSWTGTSYQSTRVIASIHNLVENTRWLACQFRAADTYCDIRMPSIKPQFYYTCLGPYQARGPMSLVVMEIQRIWMFNMSNAKQNHILLCILSVAYIWINTSYGEWYIQPTKSYTDNPSLLILNNCVCVFHFRICQTENNVPFSAQI